ncbi:MAG TPA: hypothetical protein PKM75_03070 [Prolixibacteraceae bacterium]|nr:hypothetical protein [Prolixibacteraceae bacterium]
MNFSFITGLALMYPEVLIWQARQFLKELIQNHRHGYSGISGTVCYYEKHLYIGRVKLRLPFPVQSRPGGG